MAHEVFISYATEDSPVADAVCKALEAGGVRCWYAPRDIPLAVEYEEAIVEAITDSKLLILILSTHSNISPHVKREVQNACREEPQVPVLPFQVEDISLNKSLRYYIGSLHWLSALTPPLEPHLQRLVAYVQQRLPRPGQDRDSGTQSSEPAKAEIIVEDEETRLRAEEERLRQEAGEAERQRASEQALQTSHEEKQAAPKYLSGNAPVARTLRWLHNMTDEEAITTALVTGRAEQLSIGQMILLGIASFIVLVLILGFLHSILRGPPSVADKNATPTETQQTGSTTKSPSTTTTPGALVQNQLGMWFVYVPAGSFLMGSPDYETEREADEGPQHQVTIRNGFLMGRYEVTQAQWQSVMGVNPSSFKGCDKCPVEQVSWNDVQEFIRRLNAREDGYMYRLPTEAEWEYACRAGTTTAFAYGDSLTPKQANFADSYQYRGAAKGTTPVGSFVSNEWGLYDMHGNVWEHCEDWYHDNYNGAPTDGSAWLNGRGQYRVLRGGSWDRNANALRSANRSRNNPTPLDLKEIGFRLVAVARTQ